MKDLLRLTIDLSTWLSIIILQSLSGCRGSLQITRILVPLYMRVGESGWLECEYQSEEDRLYSLSWYLGQAEFYRWTPRDIKPIKVFKIENAFRIDPYESKYGKVQIHEVSLLASGILRCEVSGEKPHFHTDFKEAKLRVTDPPDSRPIIEGVHPEYHLHQLVNLNCSSPMANPPANLTLYINDEPANEILLRRYPPIRQIKSPELTTSILGIDFQIRAKLLQGKGILRVKCVASIEGIYWESSEVRLKLHTYNQYSSKVTGKAATFKGVIKWQLPWELLLPVFFSMILL